MNAQSIPGRLLILLLLLTSGLAQGDEDRVIFNSVNHLKIELPDKRIVFKVSLRAIPRDKIIEKEVEGQFPEAWLGDEKLPQEVLWRRPTFIKSFALSIDGKNIPIPKLFWDDLIGLSLYEGKFNVAKPTEEDQAYLNEFLSSPRNQPQVSRSAHGGTVLITWARPEDGDQTSTVRWIVSKKGTVLRHHDVPEHD